MRYRIGIDSGGTFTDIMVAEEDGKIHSLKVPSTPRDPSLSFLEGVRRALEELGAGPEQVEAVLHGTTVATNALLESKFPAIGLVVIRGFREILEIARQTVPGEWGSIYVWVKPPRVAPLEREPEAVQLDVIRGLVSPESARQDYGVSLRPEGWEIAREETLRLREEIRQARGRLKVIDRGEGFQQLLREGRVSLTTSDEG
ncbi:MAG: hypothetical protein HYY20_07475 [Candidatus Tectomicrobia bacterium]|uniref:Hydantoinase/oxoprolinase N-terminal domain-containing protein n=1 Tax=Tectimicrobiota bacterium TaxID=2528274 RepID=A0A932CP44_UNCTE|nr:hypothetical protein [Candidatus Tectomicrobia bacterium]